MKKTRAVLVHTFQRGSASRFIAQGHGLVFPYTLPVGTFTVANQLMFPRSHVNSTDLKSRLPDGMRGTVTK